MVKKELTPKVSSLYTQLEYIRFPQATPQPPHEQKTLVRGVFAGVSYIPVAESEYIHKLTFLRQLLLASMLFGHIDLLHINQSIQYRDVYL